MLVTRAGIYMPAWMAIKVRKHYDNDHAGAVPEDLFLPEQRLSIPARTKTTKALRSRLL